MRGTRRNKGREREKEGERERTAVSPIDPALDASTGGNEGENERGE